MTLGEFVFLKEMYYNRRNTERSTAKQMEKGGIFCGENFLLRKIRLQQKDIRSTLNK